MKVLFVIENLGHNGHSLHALAIADALQDLNADVRIVHDGTSRDLSSSIEDRVTGFSPIPCPRLDRAHAERLSSSLKKEGWVPDVIHCWVGPITANLFALRLARHFKAAHVATMCNGNRPRLLFLHTPVSNNVTTITEEVCAPLIASRRGPRRVVKISSRMPNIGSPTRAAAEIARIRAEHGWKKDDLILLRVARYDPGYVESIAVGVKLTAMLRDGGLPVRFVHVGPPLPSSPRASFRVARDHFLRLCDQANSAAGEVIAVSDTQAAHAGPDMPFAADIVIGGAKAAMEGVIAGRPTVVVANNNAGLQGLVGPGTIDAFERSNFSSAIGDAVSIDAVARELSGLLSSRGARERYEHWATETSRERFLASSGARQHLAFYGEAAATNIGQRHLIREQLNAMGRRLWLRILPTLGSIKRRLAGGIQV